MRKTIRNWARKYGFFVYAYTLDKTGRTLNFYFIKGYFRTERYLSDKRPLYVKSMLESVYDEYQDWRKENKK